jgi:16S rRNA (guanine527-N7)-methyltransferase
MTLHQQIDALLTGFEPVSDTTIDRLTSFVSLVAKWNPTINLVAKSTISGALHRHILDSAQIFRCAETSHRLWLDIGSGGGFPGIVVSALALQYRPDLKVILVESDKRKCVFLSEAARSMGLTVSVLSKRIEDLPHQAVDVMSARALAPLSKLCGYAYMHLKPGGLAVFPKGAVWRDEVEEARRSWSFNLAHVQSVTDERASILYLKDIDRA